MQNAAAERFFVTDGGVAENRGILVADTCTAKRDRNDLKNDADSAATQAIPETSTIVIADAGSLSYQYSADRGIGTAVSGGPQVLACKRLVSFVV